MYSETTSLMIDSASLPKGISLSFIFVIPPTISPLRLDNLPLLLRFIIILSIWYRYSSKSSINNIFPSVLRSEGLPIRLYKMDRLPPTICPFASPNLLKGWWSIFILKCFPSKASFKLITALEVLLEKLIGIVVCKVATLSLCMCECKTVMSLNPANHLGFF